MDIVFLRQLWWTVDTIVLLTIQPQVGSYDINGVGKTKKGDVELVLFSYRRYMEVYLQGM